MRLLAIAVCTGALVLLAAGGGPAVGAPSPVLPYVVSWSPVAISPGVPASAVIRIVFSTTMNISSVQAALRYTDGFTVYGQDDGQSSWSRAAVADDTFAFDPNLGFASGARIDVTIDGGTAKDRAGNPLDQNRDGVGGDSFAFSFTVALDPTPPRALTVAPPNGSTSVSVSTWLEVHYSKAMNRTATESGFSVTDGVRTLGPANGTFTWSGQTVPDDRMVFNPDENLQTAATHTVRLDGATVRDRNGFLLDGNGNGSAEGSPADDHVWSFAVVAVDTTPPVVWASDPPDGAIGVPIIAQIVVTFSEKMNAASVAAAFGYATGGASFTAADGTGSWSLGGEVYAFTPLRSFAHGATYHVAINGSTARDLAGNPLGGDYAFAFTTVSQPDTARPDIVATDPSDLATHVSIRPVIKILFTEAMNRPLVQEAIAVSRGVTAVAFAWPNGNTVLFTTAAALAYATPYTVIVFRTATDLAGNRLLQTRTFEFTTTPWSGMVTGSVVDRDNHAVPNATIALGPQETLTGASGAFAFPNVEAGTYPLTVSKDGYGPYSEAVTIDAAHHDLGTIVLPEAAADAGVLPWVVVAVVAAAAILLLVLLRRRPKVEEPAPYHWRPAEAIVVPPGEERPKP